MIKIVKFGGSSVANAAQFEQVKRIVDADPYRQFVVVSACGRQHADDYKITDLLYLCHAHLQYHVNCDSIFNLIEQRFLQIKHDLQVDTPIEAELSRIRRLLQTFIPLDELVSRGEYLTAQLMADYLHYTFVDATDLIFFHYDGTIDEPKIMQALTALLKTTNCFVIPGFYGAMPDGSIKVMSRGGSDVTGSLLANVMNADVYENWTDVPGILMADPRIVSNPKEIAVISYRELRELSYMGASVLHEEAIFPVKEKNIPIHILDTNHPEKKGTVIQDHLPVSKDMVITGIAGKKDFTVITIKKNHMSNEIGLIRKALSVFEAYRISIEHIPSGIDTFSILVETAAIKAVLYELVTNLKESCRPDDITVLNDIALIATVSRKMKNVAGMSGRLFTALGKQHINVAVISQNSDEMNIIVGVHNSDYERTIRAIYEEFDESRLPI